MARIRTIKPDFFRHESLQSLGPIPMLFFVGLWTQADKAGNFPWRPAQLKLDILPFVEYDVSSTLEALRIPGFVLPYTGDDGKPYGHIPNFDVHQRFFGSEIKSPPKYPAFISKKQDMEALESYHGSTKEVTRTVESGIRNQDSGIRSPSAKDEFWNPLCQIFGLEPKTQADELRLYDQCRDFRLKGATIPELERRAGIYRLSFPNVAFTPKAVLANWDNLKEPPKPKAPAFGPAHTKKSQALT